VTTFVHSGDGTDEAAWLAQSWLQRLPRLGLPPITTAIVVLAPHPDDETLGAGGLISAAAQAGHRVSVIVASDGAASHPLSGAMTPPEMAAVRASEVRAAVGQLGDDVDLILLGYPDGQLDRHVEALTDAVRSAMPDGPTWLLTTWRGDRHPDHEACAKVAEAAASDRLDVRRFEFPVWWWHWQPAGRMPVDLVDLARRLDLGETHQRRKQRAIREFGSQLNPIGPEPADAPVLTASFTAHFERDFEVFFETGDHPARGNDYFEQLYQGRADPWHVAGRFYEDRRRSLIIAALAQPHFRRVFEPGCGNGELSVMLADRCAELICMDAATGAVETTTERLRAYPHARVACATLPRDWPAGSFDLIVVSEFAYFSTDLVGLAEQIHASLTDDGALVLVHWRWPAADHPYTAETVHATIAQFTDLHLVVEHTEADFILQVLSRDPRSIAQRAAMVP
jgi:LmbE family N-acetylglucosaminyl deacetylase/SAM-dependent methyltransferase